MPNSSLDISTNPAASKYLFNDLYDPEVIRDIVNKHRTTLFKMNLENQKTLCNNTIYYGNMGMFQHKPYFNELEKIPVEAYTCKLMDDVVPYYSKKKYYDKYGGVPVSLIDIMWNDKIFARRCVMTIGEYTFFHLYMKPTSFGTILYIVPDRNKGISEATLLEMINNNIGFSLRFEPQSPTGYTYKRKSLVFTDGVVKAKILDWNTLYDYRKINMWKSYMSSSREDVNLLCQTNCTYDSTGDWFVMSTSYVEHAFSHIENCKIYIVNQKNFDGYSTLQDGVFYFRIPLEEGQNPVPLQNIHIYEYDSENDRYLEIKNPEITHHYPNIYTFKRDNNRLLRVEWDRIDNMPGCNFENVFKDYIDFVGEDEFVKETIEGTLPEPWASFVPSEPIYPDIKEFLESDKESLDDYYVGKLEDILKENPDLYKEIFESLIKPNKPDKNDDLVIEVPEVPEIPDRETNNNSDAVTDPDETEVWDDLFVWVTIDNPTDEPYDVTVTVDGVFTEVDHTYVKDGLQYIYVPSEMVEDDSVIIVTIHDCPKEPEEGDFTFTHVDSAIPMPPNFNKVSAKSLLFYDMKTKFYIDINLLKFYLKAQSTYISGNLGVNDEHGTDYVIAPNIVSKDGKEIKTSDNKQFRVLTTTRVKDRSCYLIDVDKEALLTFYKEPLVTYNDFVVVPGPEVPDGFSKPLPAEDLEVATKEPALIGMRIGVVSTNVHRIYKYEDVRFTDTVTVPHFKLDPSKKRFRLYLNGIVAIPGEDYEYKPQLRYGDDAVFKLINQTYVDSTEPVKLIIEYLPLRSEMVYCGLDVIEFNNDRDKIMMDLSSVLTMPIMRGVTEIYINGVKIPEDMINVMGNNKAVVNISDLEKLSINPDEEMRVTVFEEDHDDDLYNYTVTNGITLSTEYMKDNETFKDWLISQGLYE